MGQTARRVMLALLLAPACSPEKTETPAPLAPTVRLFDSTEIALRAGSSTVLRTAESGEELARRGALWATGNSSPSLKIASGVATLSEPGTLVRQLEVGSRAPLSVRLWGEARQGDPEVNVVALHAAIDDLPETVRAPGDLSGRIAQVLTRIKWSEGARADPNCCVLEMVDPPRAAESVLITIRNQGVVSISRLEVREDLPSRPGRIRIGQETRRAVGLAGEEPLEWDLPELAGGEVVSVGFGIPDHLPRIDADLKATARLRIGSEVVHQQVVFRESRGPRPVRQWQSVRLEVPDTAGGQGVLEVELSGPEGAGLVVAEPSVHRRRIASDRPNLVLISLDTLRADRLGCYGYPRGSSPRIDQFAARSMRFERVYSPANFTLPAHASMMTGVHPLVHGARRLSDRISIGSFPSLARTLSQAGYHSAAFTGGGYVDAAFGFDQGFDRYSMVDPLMSRRNLRREIRPLPEDPDYNQRLHDAVSLDTVKAWLEDECDGPFFLFLHTYRIHEYCPEQATAEKFCADVEASDLGWNAGHKIGGSVGTIQRGSADLRHLTDFYDATVFDTDRAIGELLDHLERLDLADDTVVAITSDHGEGFLEHEVLFHSRGLYDELLRVPLILHVPGQAPAVIRSAAGLVDLAPTLLDVLGLDPLPTASGRSLQPLWSTGSQAGRSLLAQDCWPDGSVFSAWIEDPYKLIRDESQPVESTRLFDWRADPGEQTDLATLAELEAIRASLDAELARQEQRRTEIEASLGQRSVEVDLSDELEKLGYVLKDD